MLYRSFILTLFILIGSTVLAFSQGAIFLDDKYKIEGIELSNIQEVMLPDSLCPIPAWSQGGGKFLAVDSSGRKLYVITYEAGDNFQFLAMLPEGINSDFAWDLHLPLIYFHNKQIVFIDGRYEHRSRVFSLNLGNRKLEIIPLLSRNGIKGMATAKDGEYYLYNQLVSNKLIKAIKMRGVQKQINVDGDAILHPSRRYGLIAGKYVYDLEIDSIVADFWPKYNCIITDYNVANGLMLGVTIQHEGEGVIKNSDIQLVYIWQNEKPSVINLTQTISVQETGPAFIPGTNDISFFIENDKDHHKVTFYRASLIVR